jgi:hypothetical protein
VVGSSGSAGSGADLMTFDQEEIVTLSGQGKMTLRTAIERVVVQKLQGLNATIFREGDPSILGLTQIEKIAAEWGMG